MTKLVFMAFLFSISLFSVLPQLVNYISSYFASFLRGVLLSIDDDGGGEKEGLKIIVFS